MTLPAFYLNTRWRSKKIIEKDGKKYPPFEMTITKIVYGYPDGHRYEITGKGIENWYIEDRILSIKEIKEKFEEII